MSFNPKPNKPDSKDTAKLRVEYEKKKQEMRDSSDPATKAKLKDESQKLFSRVTQQQIHERQENLSQLQKVLISQGKLKTDAQMQQEREKAAGKTAARLNG